MKSRFCCVRLSPSVRRIPEADIEPQAIGDAESVAHYVRDVVHRISDQTLARPPVAAIPELEPSVIERGLRGLQDLDNAGLDVWCFYRPGLVGQDVVAIAA